MTAKSPSCVSSRVIRRCISSLLRRNRASHCGVDDPRQQQIILVAGWEKHRVRDAESAEAIPGIFLVSVATGSKHRLTKPDVSGSGDWSPAYSPDGRSPVFQRNAGSARRSLCIPRLSDRDGNLRDPPSRIPLDFTDLTSYSSWSAGGEALILTRASGLFRVPKAGGKAEPLPFADASEPTVSRDGSKLVFSQALRDTDIYRVQLQTGEVKKIISSTRRDDEAYLSADGRRVAFISHRSGADTLWVADSDGGRAVPLVTFGGPSIGTPHWSPDGEEIAFDSLRGRFFSYLCHRVKRWNMAADYDR